MQAASYPPGYGIMLSILMWMTGMKPTASFLVGYESSFAILMYRLLVFGLNGALFLLLAMYLKRLGSAKTGVWLAVLLLIMLLIPSTAGKHIASETVLFPMLSAAIVLVAAGQRFSAPVLTTIGLAVAGMATLIKSEATLLLAIAVLPWLTLSLQPSIARPPRAVKLRWATILAVSLLPTLIWKTTLEVHNEFFAPVTWSRFVSSVSLLPGLAFHALRLTLEDGRFLVLIIALPCAVMFQVRRSPHWSTIMVPLSVITLFAIWVGIFLFSNLSPHTYLETSYTRLVMVPTFSAILYCADALQDGNTAPRGEA
jgi:hypothetical protein